MSNDPEVKRNYVSVPSGRLSRLINLTGMSAGITGNILFAADNPCLIDIFKVAKDLTGWYANIIAARNEKKLLISISSFKISFPE